MNPGEKRAVDRKSTGECTTSQPPDGNLRRSNWQFATDESALSGDRGHGERRRPPRTYWNHAMKRSLFFAYGVICYLLFLGIYAYFCAFTANVLTPWSIDAPVVGSWQSAVVINLALIAAFGIQHSVMARPAFKRRWTRIVPQPIERSTYVLASVLANALLVWQWRPIDAIVWDVQNSIGRGVLWALFAIGWLMVPLVTLMINHFDLFGLRK